MTFLKSWICFNRFKTKVLGIKRTHMNVIKLKFATLTKTRRIHIKYIYKINGLQIK